MFGEIRFGRTFGIVGVGFWDGEAAFPLQNKRIRIRIESDSSGPTLKQREFFTELKTRYVVLIDAISSLIIDAPLPYFGPDFFGKLMPALEWEDFELAAVGIGRSEPAQVWHLSYSCKPMDQTYSISFEGWTPMKTQLDD